MLADNLDEILDNMVNIDTVPGLEFRTLPDYQDLQQTWQNYSRLLAEEALYSVQQGDVVLDVGAHHGIVAMNCAVEGATVYAVEPHPVNFAILQENLARNEMLPVALVQRAVSDTSGYKEFQLGETLTTGSLVDSRRGWKATEEKIEVTTSTISEIMDDYDLDHIDLLKIDCEGGEYDCLFGMSTEDLSCIHNIILEAHPTDRYAPQDLVAFLKDRGYTVKGFEVDHGCFEIVAWQSKNRVD